MSAPDTEVEKQAKRHRPALLGFVIVVGLALLMFVGLLLFLSDEGGTPEGAETQIDGRTGEVVTE